MEFGFFATKSSASLVQKVNFIAKLLHFQKKFSSFSIQCRKISKIRRTKMHTSLGREMECSWGDAALPPTPPLAIATLSPTEFTKCLNFSHFCVFSELTNQSNFNFLRLFCIKLCFAIHVSESNVCFFVKWIVFQQKMNEMFLSPFLFRLCCWE